MRNWQATPKTTRYGGMRLKSSACSVNPVPHMTDASSTEMSDPWFTQVKRDGAYTPTSAAHST